MIKKERHPLNPSLKDLYQRTRLRHYNVCTGADAAIFRSDVESIYIRYDGLHTGIKNARMRCNRTELAVLWYILKSLSTANMQILFYYPSTLARFFLFFLFAVPFSTANMQILFYAPG